MEQNYQSVRTIFFNKFTKLDFDLFIKLSDQKFVKILNSGDSISPDFINKYVSKKIFEFFLTNEDYAQFRDQIFDFHSSAQEVLVEGRKIRVPCNENLNIMIESMGISPKETKRINEMTTRLVTDLNTEDSDITKLVKRFTTSDERFQYDHSYLTAVMSCQIAGQNEWGTNPNKEKLCLASIIHDLNHKVTDLESSLSSQDFSQGVNPNEKERTQKLSQSLRKVERIPIDVISIIENHLQINRPNLSPMTCCFVVGHQFVIELYKNKFDQDSIPDICNHLAKTFPEGNLRKQVDHLISSLKQS